MLFRSNYPENSAVSFATASGIRYVRRLDENGTCSIPSDMLFRDDGAVSIAITDTSYPFTTYRSDALQSSATENGFIVFPCLEIATENAMQAMEQMDSDIKRFRSDLDALRDKLQHYMEGYDLV